MDFYFHLEFNYFVGKSGSDCDKKTNIIKITRQGKLLTGDLFDFFCSWKSFFFSACFQKINKLRNAQSFVFYEQKAFPGNFI
jgi:hypothetical protein